MSYDLGLYPRAGATLRRKAVFDYLSGDYFSHEGDEVHYSHPDTGVYFHFTRVKGGKRDSDDPNEGGRTHVYFNMNFYRPHTFGLEAAEVLGRFVERFDLTVDDPQSEGMGQGEYSREGFLRGWNAGNR